MAKFRFEDLEIWKEAIKIAQQLFRIADELEHKKLWRFADQVRGVALSMPNNISESTGTDKIGEQQQLLRYSRRECFEMANMLIILWLENHIGEEQKVHLLERLYMQSRKINSYSKSLERKEKTKYTFNSMHSALCPMLYALCPMLYAFTAKEEG